MRILRSLALAATMGLAIATTASAQNCKKGKPCGHSCIAQNKVCRIGTAPAAPTPAPAPVEQPLMLAAPADSTAPATGAWVGSPRGDTYYLNAASCSGGRKLKNRIYFRSEADALAAGYHRSVQKGC